MAWDFETDPEFQKELDWIESFVTQAIAMPSVLPNVASRALMRDPIPPPC
jgi:acyl-CoA dehydrogenase